MIDRGQHAEIPAASGIVALLRGTGRSQIDRMTQGYPYIFQHDIIAAGGAHANRIPGLDNAETRSAGRYIEIANPWRGLVGQGPDVEPAQDGRAGGIKLVTG